MKSAWVVGQDGWCWTLLMCNIKITLWPHTRPKRNIRGKPKRGFINKIKKGQGRFSAPNLTLRPAC